ncbi:MAG: recombinase family protein [Deltaproteobacteria bacterium]|nr:recombinase family protein [Deltaproteobacteria bacterium]
MNQILDNIVMKMDRGTAIKRLKPGSEVYAGAYLRQSTADKQNSHGVDEQLEFIRHRLSSEQVRSVLYPDCKIILPDELVFVDHGMTGRVEVCRDQYVKFKNAMREHRFQIGLVFDLSRLTRELGSLLDALSLADTQRIELISVSELISSHSTGARNHFIFKGIANEMQSESISRQTRRGLELRALSGKSTGMCPYGFKSVREDPTKVRELNEPANKIVIIDEEKAPVVRRIFDLYSSSQMGIDAIARLLNSEKIPAPRGKLWGGRAIWGVLNQPKYIGVWIYGKTRIVRDSSKDELIQVHRPQEEWVKKVWEDRRIISQALWDRVHTRLEKVERERKEARNKPDSLWGKNRGQANHLFSGTMACSECGGNFIVISGRRGGYAGCHNAYRKKTCTNKKGVQVSWVENSLLNLFKGWLSDPKSLQIMSERFNRKMSEKLSVVPKRIMDLEKELEKVEKGILRFVTFLSEGYPSDAVTEGLKREETRKNIILSQLDHLKAEKPKSVLMTPFAIKDELVNLDEIVKGNVQKANIFFQRLFPSPIKMTPKQRGRKYFYEASGEVNLTRLARDPILKRDVLYRLSYRPALQGGPL